MRAAAAIATSVLVLAGVTLLAEVLIRLFVPVSDFARYFWDPLVGPRREPDQSGVMVLGGARGRYHFNAQGWNHPDDYWVPKPPGTKRICLVGDSYVEAMHVQPEETHFQIAEQLMNRPDRPVQWYAFGCSGFGTAQEYLVIRNYVLDYDPDVVVLLFVGNDLYDTSPYLLSADHRGATFSLDDSGNLLLIPARPWKVHPLKRWAVSSALVRYLFVDHNMLRRQGRADRALAALAGNSEFHALAGDAMSMEERGRKSWELTEAILRATRDECARRGARLVLAWYGHRGRLNAFRSGGTHVPKPREHDPWCLDVNGRIDEMGDDLLSPIALRLGIPYVDLTEPILQEMRRTGTRYDLPGDPHYGPTAHAAVGNALAGKIERLWVD